jgi:DNA-binding NtrC family response regulator
MMEQYDIVYVDDEPMMTSIFMQMINMNYRSWRVLVMNDAMELYRRIEERSISARVWIIDLVMPGKNGVQIAEAVREAFDGSTDLVGYTALDIYTLGHNAEYSPALDIFSRVISKQEGIMRMLGGLSATTLCQKM